MDSRDDSQPSLKRKRDEDDIVKTELQELSKKERRRISNLLAARKSRAEKKKEREDLQQTVEHQAEMLASFEQLQIQHEITIQTLLIQHATDQTEITNLQAEITNLEAELEQYETTTYNPDTRCYARGTKIGFDLHPTLFFRQEDRRQSSSPDPALGDGDAPLPPIKEEEIYFAALEFGKY